MKFQIKSWWDSDKILFEAELEAKYEGEPREVQLGAAVRLAVKAGASLDGARLDGASLVRARLDGASLVRARLDGARLDGASLVRASLDGASLVRASLDGARLDGASLVRARLDGASLVRASLDGARLDGASLVGASLDGASLDYIKYDFITAILKLPNEIPFLRQALVDGKIDGSTYSTEGCSCLAGTFAKACNFKDALGTGVEIKNGFKADSQSLREVWFVGIRPGNTPENHTVAKITLEWIDEALGLIEMIRKAA